MKKKRGHFPDWSEVIPDSGTYRSIFKWGAPGEFKHPNRGFYELIKEKLGMTDDDFQKRSKEGKETVTCEIPTRLSPEQVAAFKRLVGEENVAVDDYSRVKFSSGKTAEELLRLRDGAFDSVADVVIHPRDKEDVVKIVAFCNDSRIPIHVYGGGSSVSLGLKCVRGGIALAMGTHMNRVLDFNETNQTITVEPGISGPALEAELNEAPKRVGAKRSYTCGHFPQSFEFSTVGGWIAALGSGQQSSYYGDMYDIVLSQEYVTPAGVFKTRDYPSTATGPKVNDIMKGSEGAFGVLVGATLKIFRHLPSSRKRFAFVFPGWQAAIDASREIFQGEFGAPSMYRISDPEETDAAFRIYGIEGTPIERMLALRGLKPMRRCLCIGHTEGELGFARNVKRKIKKISKDYGGVFITGYPVAKWEHGRFSDPYMREDLNDFGVLIDTLEAGVTWDNLHALHQGVRDLLKSRPNTICMTHASHFYPQGTNLYFIFITRTPDIEEYQKLRDGIIDKIEQLGGSLSHHHGVGKLMAPWMDRHLGEVQMGVLRAVKKHFDPNNIMNPGGTLGLDS
ncbi:MAG: FAD-binding oxidoreductase [Deltaproteobacteria bacterium]|nr:FAD-binding oxidoreductase [Deltaproteobacteria bacterium]